MNNAIRALPFFMLLGLASPVSAFVIDFETDGAGNTIGEGQVIDNEYSVGVPGATGLTAAFSATNLSYGPDLAVIYDSDPGTGRDPDLEAPFTNVLNGDGIANGTILNPGNILIIQENDWGCSGPNPTFCSHPDDEGSRPAGSFEITFNEEITLESIDLFDIEWVELGGIKLYNSADVLLASYDINGTGGDNTYTTLSLLTDNVARMTIAMGGSGAIDNIVGSYDPDVPSVSTPASLALMLVGLGAFLRPRTSTQRNEAPGNREAGWYGRVLIRPACHLTQATLQDGAPILTASISKSSQAAKKQCESPRRRVW